MWDWLTGCPIINRPKQRAGGSHRALVLQFGRCLAEARLCRLTDWRVRRAWLWLLPCVCVCVDCGDMGMPRVLYSCTTVCALPTHAFYLSIPPPTHAFDLSHARPTHTFYLSIPRTTTLTHTHTHTHTHTQEGIRLSIEVFDTADGTRLYSAEGPIKVSASRVVDASGIPPSSPLQRITPRHPCGVCARHSSFLPLTAHHTTMPLLCMCVFRAGWSSGYAHRRLPRHVPPPRHQPPPRGK